MNYLNRHQYKRLDMSGNKQWNVLNGTDIIKMLNLVNNLKRMRIKFVMKKQSPTPTSLFHKV